MYQKIDEIDGPDMAIAPQAKENGTTARRWLLACVIIGFLAMLAATIWKLSQDPIVLSHPADQTDAVTAFNKVQAEPRAAVRRARLIDFVQTHPNSPVINSARQQLRVMNEYESDDWAALSDAMFSDVLSPIDKRVALEHYTTQWGEGLVGSRDTDIESYKSELDSLSENKSVDRRQKIEASPISGEIDGTRMAGGHVRTIAPSYPVIAPTTPQPAPRAITPEIISLQIRTSERPDYPRRAYSRGIPAVVKVTYNVNEKGRTVLVKVTDVQATRYERDFKRAAKKAAQKTRYYPRTVNGVATPVTGITKTYVFDPSR